QTFLDNLEDGGITDLDVNNADEVEIDDDVFLDRDIRRSHKEEFFVEAQMAPDASPVEAPPAATELDTPATEPAKAPAVDMTADQVKQGPDVSGVKNDLDALMDSAFATITTQDIIDKLESVSKIFRNREIGRQLAIVDIMMNHIGI